MDQGLTTTIPTLPAETVAALVDAYFEDLDVRPWNRFRSFDWSAVDSSLLSEDQRIALSFITYIEDHSPGYFAEYHRLFPVAGDVDPDEFVHNREIYRFSVKWAQEEDAHAHVLFAYQVRGGLDTPDSLRRKLAEEGRKRFCLQATHPIQVFAYTLIQEKATQLFYQQFARSLREPVLRDILVHLVRDEARHFAFFSRLVEEYVRRAGATSIPPIQEVLERFKMPLADTLRGYWRLSLRVADAVGGYDHAEAYEHLVRTVTRCAEASTWSRTQDLASMVRAIRGIA
jgi:hypothetical protein